MIQSKGSRPRILSLLSQGLLGVATELRLRTFARFLIWLHGLDLSRDVGRLGVSELSSSRGGAQGPYPCNSHNGLPCLD